MINVTLKMMNGDLVEIAHKTYDGETAHDRLDRFYRSIYKACPHVPYGCVKLFRPLPEEVVDDEVASMMALSDVYSTYPYEKVTYVTDDDFLYAFVDKTMVEPFITPTWNGVTVLGRHSLPVTSFTVQFFEVNKNDWNDENDNGVYPISEISLCYVQNKGFALEDTLTKPTPQEAAFTDRNRLPHRINETKNTEWFSTIGECLRSIENARFPTDDDMIERIRVDFHGNWRDVDDVDDANDWDDDLN